MVSIFRTSIFSEDELEFRSFLEGAGFSDFHLFPANGDNVYLNIQFEKETSLFTYKLRGLESNFRALHSNTYYYDLDQDFDSEADEFFGNDSDYT